MLEINNIKVNVLDKVILDDFSLKINDGEIHCLMGQNGIGKSTICKVIMGDSNYTVSNGTIKYNNLDLLNMTTTDRARNGIMLINQNPITIEGVSNASMLRSALQEKLGRSIDIFKFNKELSLICDELDLPKSFIHRNINEGMSGGERKKNELMHMWVLKPSFIILDELDSGLDVDSLKLCSNSIMKYYQEYKPSILIITHHVDLLKTIKPNYVHIIKNKKIIKTGDLSLALDIEKNGFNNFSGTNKISEKLENE